MNKYLLLTTVVLIAFIFQTQAQNVGIGKASPNQKLDVDGVIRSEGNYLIDVDGQSSSGPSVKFGESGTPDAYMQIGAYNSINNIDIKGRDLKIFSSSAPDAFFLDESNGNVGIGMVSPSKKLEVHSGADIIANFKRTSSNSVGIALEGSSGDMTRIYGADKALRVFHQPNGGTSSELLTIETNGNVGIGSNPGSYKLFVNGNTNIDGTLNLQNGTNINEFSTDGTLGDNSDDALPTEQAVKTYIDNLSDEQKLTEFVNNNERLVYHAEEGIISGSAITDNPGISTADGRTFISENSYFDGNSNGLVYEVPYRYNGSSGSNYQLFCFLFGSNDANVMNNSGSTGGCYCLYEDVSGGAYRIYERYDANWNLMATISNPQVGDGDWHNAKVLVHPSGSELFSVHIDGEEIRTINTSETFYDRRAGYFGLSESGNVHEFRAPRLYTPETRFPADKVVFDGAIQIKSGASAGKILVSDGNGNASWENTNNLGDDDGVGNRGIINKGSSNASTQNLAAGISLSGSGSGTTATDGSKTVGSSYQSFGNGNQSGTGPESSYLQLDLGSDRTISQHKIYFYNGNARYYWFKLKYSYDGTNWYYAVGNADEWTQSAPNMPTAPGNGNIGYVTDVRVPSITARYWRLYSNGSTSNGGNHIYEWEALREANPVAMDIDDHLYVGGSVDIGGTSGSYELYVNGKIGSNGINETSDRRFKKDIHQLEGSLEKVNQLRGVSYYWRHDEFPDRKFEEGKDIGVIAQEIEAIFPELVKTDNDGYKSVEYSHLVPVLLEAIKELKAEKDKEISALKADIQQYESLLNSIDIERLKQDYCNTENQEFSTRK